MRASTNMSSEHRSEPQPPIWITTREAAEISGYHVNYIRRLIRAGKIAAEKKGNAWWVDASAFRSYIEAAQQKADRRYGAK